MVYFTFFFTITLFLYAFLLFHDERRQRIQRRMAMFLNKEKQKQSAEEETAPSFFKRICYPLWLELKKSFKRRRVPGEKEAKLEIKLLQAGNPFGMATVEFRLLQLALMLLLPFFFGVYAVMLKASFAAVFIFALFGLVMSLFLPHFYLKQKIKTRSHLALKQLPDILDLLTVSLEAGLGFDAALSKVVAKKNGVLSQEFHRCLEEIRLGKTRREALVGVKERLVVDEVSVLISNILQAEKLGIGMVQVLRVQSNEVRERRKQRAEEEAMKAPIKMLFPLVLFIFPSLFIVLLGPAVIQFIEAF
ncbi:pilus assembly protein TadC [Anaerobacillus arseniciselenatis]|uniref:Pilus assembly protein TadC n=1 Tax=Anaerobacillus arseniciselenatis TaxID=85682 RepID=A0A1S2LQ38_9BACI|nr:type II secretion system F family protein [Anaerobacillus arseniciselenatis]OIJ14632.1 pilus assembly protein TadC [Anaerobacillus arseniciselenatis]